MLDAYAKETREAIFFPCHLEYHHDKFTINPDGTIHVNQDPSWVLGTDDSVTKVKYVKKGDKN